MGAVALPLLLFLYAYIGYPLLLLPLYVRSRSREEERQKRRQQWPRVSVSLPAYNEASTIRDTLENLLAVDYPSDSLQIVVVSDASTDGTDEIVREFASQGVELTRQDQRRGKTAAENAAIPHLDGEIVVNIDATIRITPGSLKPLVRAFDDPTVGVASGRDVSIAPDGGVANLGESGYVGYEMLVRAMETSVDSIVGASGCFYAIRKYLHRKPVDAHLSRDFAAALTAREHGYRSVSVDDAVCLVPRTRSLLREFRRKTRTMDRGLATLWSRRSLMNPFKHGRFAWMLVSHKLCRWLVPATVPLGLVALLWLTAVHAGVWTWVSAAVIGVLMCALVELRWPEDEAGSCPRLVSICGYGIVSLCAGMLAWAKALLGEGEAVWEPTRR